MLLVGGAGRAAAAGDAAVGRGKGRAGTVVENTSGVLQIRVGKGRRERSGAGSGESQHRPCRSRCSFVCVCLLLPSRLCSLAKLLVPLLKRTVKYHPKDS